MTQCVDEAWDRVRVRYAPGTHIPKDEEAAKEPKAEDTLDEDVAKDSAKPPDNPTIIKSLKAQTTHHSQQSNSANRTNQ